MFCYGVVLFRFHWPATLVSTWWQTPKFQIHRLRSWSWHHHLHVVLFVSQNVPATFLQLISCVLAIPIRMQNTRLHLQSTAQIIANACHNGVDDELFDICRRQIWLISRFEKAHDRQPTISKCRIPQIHIHAAMRMNSFQISIVLLDAVWFWLESFWFGFTDPQHSFRLQSKHIDS